MALGGCASGCALPTRPRPDNVLLRSVLWTVRWLAAVGGRASAGHPSANRADCLRHPRRRASRVEGMPGTLLRLALILSCVVRCRVVTADADEGRCGGEHGRGQLGVPAGRAASSEVIRLRGGYDIASDNIVALGTLPPEGNLPEGVIAGWPIAKAGSSRNRHTKGMQPRVVLLDTYNMKRACSTCAARSWKTTPAWCDEAGSCTDVSHEVTATIFNNPGCAKLHGTTTVQTVDGVATFTDLMIDSPQSLYRLRFTAGLLLSPVAAQTPPFNVLQGQIYIPDDALWNYPASGSAACRGCYDSSCNCTYAKHFDPPWAPDSDGAQARMTTRAGELIRSSGNPGSNFRPCAGFEFPTVWVRTYNVNDQQAGSECDGWEDRHDWNHAIQVSIPEPGCVLQKDDKWTGFEDHDIKVCRMGMSGTLIRSSQEIESNGGVAEFNDLRIYEAGEHSLRFSSDGMLSTSYPVVVLPNVPHSFLILRIWANADLHQY